MCMCDSVVSHAGLQPSMSNVGLPDRQDPHPAEQMEEQPAAAGPGFTAAEGRGAGTAPEAVETDTDPRCSLFSVFTSCDTEEL